MPFGGYNMGQKGDAIALKRLATRERTKPNKRETVKFPERLQNTLRATVAVPLTTVPAASIVSGKYVLGKAQAYIYNRNQDSPDDLIQHLKHLQKTKMAITEEQVHQEIEKFFNIRLKISTKDWQKDTIDDVKKDFLKGLKK